MRFRKRHSFIGQDQSSGWIAMTDLFTILTIVAISAGAANITTIKNIFKGVNGPWTTFMNEAAKQKVELDFLNKKIKSLEEEITRLKTELDSKPPSPSDFSDEIKKLKFVIFDLNQELTDLKNKYNVLELDLEKKKKN